MFNCSGGEWIVEALRLLEKSKPLKRIVYSLIALAVYYITPSLLTAIASIMVASG